MRRLFALSSTLVLTLGCGKDDTSEAKAECQLEAIDLSSCQRSSLASLQPEGVWNLNVQLNDGTGAATAMRLSGSATGASMLGFTVTERQVSGDTFFLASDVVGTNDLKLRYALAGCSAAGPGQMAGVFRRCQDGRLDIQGTFEAVRVARRDGEAESDKVSLVGEAALPSGIATELAVANGYAYVTAGSEGLFIYDVSDPAAPRKVAQSKVADDGLYNDVLVNGTTMYLGTKGRGIVVYDLTDPKAPARVRSVPDTAVEVNALAVDGNVLYAASATPNAEVLIYDITTPTSPKLLTRYYVEGAEPSTGERPLDVVAMGGKLYVSHWTYGLTVSDVTNPTKPKLLGRFGGASSRTTAVGTVGSRTLAFDAGEDWGAHLSVLNVTVPSTPEQVGEFRLRPEVSIRSVTLAGTKLYVAYYQDGLRVLDVSVPGEPRQVGYYNTWREADVGRGVTFFEGLNTIRVPGDGYIYATETSRGLLVFKETE